MRNITFDDKKLKIGVVLVSSAKKRLIEQAGILNYLSARDSAPVNSMLPKCSLKLITVWGRAINGSKSRCTSDGSSCLIF